MNMLNKEECEKAFKRLNGMIITSPFEEDLIDYNDLKKYDTQLQNDFMDDVMVFMQLIEEHFNPQPYKFEDLKVGMWVWDDKGLYCFECNPAISKNGTRCVTYNSFWYNSGEDKDEFFEEYDEFEEGRFFPLTKALEYQR